MSKLKNTYLRAVILKNDILTYHNDLNNEQDWNKKLRLFKNCFIALDILRDSFNHFNEFLKEKTELTKQARDLKKRLQFPNHIRNKISGHLEQGILEKAVQWQPLIFCEKIKNNEEAMLSLIYKALLESAINSYVDEESNQKVFNTEIDLMYPPNQKLFYNYVGELNQDAIKFLIEIINVLNAKIEYLDKYQMIKMVIKAAKTEFNLKK